LRPRTLLNLVVLIAFAVFCIGGLGFLAAGMGMPVPVIQQGWQLRASFAQAEGLVSQADVDVSGVKVGKVLSVAQQGQNGVLVTMQIDDSQVRLRRDVKAYVRPKSLIGEKFVELVRAPRSTAAYIGNGFQIGRDHTGQAIEIDAILNSLDPQTRASLSQSLRDLGVAVDGRAGDINQSIPQVEQAATNLRPLAQTADRRQQELDRILVDLATIMQALADEQNALGRVVDSGDTTVTAISNRNRDLAGTVDQANTLMISLDRIFQDVTPADRASLEKGPGTIESGRALLSQLNPTIDQLLPELLLAQINYPQNQLGISQVDAHSLAEEFLSAFSQNDSLGHAFRVTPVLDPGTAVQPGLQLPVNLSPGPGQPGSQSPSTTQGAAGQTPVPTRDASGGVIPSVIQMLLGLPK
jgi:phospholipid/cholesterol/gamma-HCH transport system substrate-binding protein